MAQSPWSGDYSSFFVSVNRSYKTDNGFEDSNLYNPPDLLQLAEMVKQAWEFILAECNRE